MYSRPALDVVQYCIEFILRTRPGDDNKFLLFDKMKDCLKPFSTNPLVVVRGMGR